MSSTLWRNSSSDKPPYCDEAEMRHDNDDGEEVDGDAERACSKRGASCLMTLVGGKCSKRKV